MFLNINSLEFRVYTIIEKFKDGVIKLAKKNKFKNNLYLRMEIIFFHITQY